MTKAAYSPMHKSPKGVTQEQMWETLARHAKVEVEVHRKKAAQTPKAELRVPLQWHEPVKTGPMSGYVLSQCGRFSICKFEAKGTHFYEAWRRKEPPHEGISLGIRTSRREAERLCEAANSV